MGCRVRLGAEDLPPERRPMVSIRVDKDRAVPALEGSSTAALPEPAALGRPARSGAEDPPPEHQTMVSIRVDKDGEVPAPEDNSTVEAERAGSPMRQR